MRYSVIIPTLNGEKQIGSLLETLQTQSLPPSQILVVDSQSDDATVEHAQSVAGVRVEMIRRQDLTTAVRATGRFAAVTVMLSSL